MAKQTFTTGQVLTAAQMTSLQQTAMGGGSTTAKTASYVLVAADAGTVVQMNSASATTITVNTALFAAGDTVQIQNVGAGVCTVTAGTATVSTSAVLALKQYDAGSLYFNSTSAALFFAADAADNTSPLTTKGDIYTFSTTNDRLPVGTNNQTLVADSTASTGLKWATPAGGSGMTLLSTTTLSGTSTVISSIDQTYNSLFVLVYGVTNTIANGYFTVRFNGSATIAQDQATASNTTVVDCADMLYLQQVLNYLTYTDSNNSASFSIHNYASSANYKTFTAQGVYNGGGTALAWGANGGIKTNTAISSLEFVKYGGGSFNAGTVKIYGVK